MTVSPIAIQPCGGGLTDTARHRIATQMRTMANMPRVYARNRA